MKNYNNCFKNVLLLALLLPLTGNNRAYLC